MGKNNFISLDDLNEQDSINAYRQEYGLKEASEILLSIATTSLKKSEQTVFLFHILELKSLTEIAKELHFTYEKTRLLFLSACRKLQKYYKKSKYLKEIK